MNTHRTFSLLSLVATILLALVLNLTGCDNESAKERSGAASDKSASGGNHEQVIEAFARSIDAGDYAAAYAMTSSHVRNKMTADAFAKFHKDARTEYGKPLKHIASLSTDDREELEGDEYDDTGIPAKDRLAWMNIMWALEVDGAGDIERCYETWVMMVKEKGQNKVGSMEYGWCD